MEEKENVSRKIALTYLFVFVMLINIGYSNFVDADKIVAIVSSDSAPAKRIIREAKKNSQLIDATAGHKTRSVVVLIERQVLISAHMPETIADKVAKSNG